MTFIEIIIFLVLIFLIYLFVSFRDMKKYPRYHPWPSITRCRICEKRVFVWQRRERREFKVELENPNNLAVGCKSSGIVHKHCKGNPVFKMSVK